MPIRVGTRVVSIALIADEDRVIAVPGDAGVVVDYEGPFPTVKFDRTGAASIVDPDGEIRPVRVELMAQA